MRNDIVLAYKNNELTPYDIQGSQLLELLDNDETREVGLNVIADGYMRAVNEELNQRMDRYNLVDSYTKETIERYKDVVYINDNGEIEVSRQGVYDLVRREIDTMVCIEDDEVQYNIVKIISNIFNVRRNIRTLVVNKQINDKIRYIERVYLDDDSSPLQLPKQIEAGINELNTQLKKGKLDRMIKRKEPQKLYKMFCESFSEIPKVFEKLHDDLEELNSLIQDAR